MNDLLHEFTTSPIWLIAGYVLGRCVQHLETTNRRHHRDHS